MVSSSSMTAAQQLKAQALTQTQGTTSVGGQAYGVLGAGQGAYVNTYPGSVTNVTSVWPQPSYQDPYALRLASIENMLSTIMMIINRYDPIFRDYADTYKKLMEPPNEADSASSR